MIYHGAGMQSYDDSNKLSLGYAISQEIGHLFQQVRFKIFRNGFSASSAVSAALSPTAMEGMLTAVCNWYSQIR